MTEIVSQFGIYMYKKCIKYSYYLYTCMKYFTLHWKKEVCKNRKLKHMIYEVGGESVEWYGIQVGEMWK